MFQLGVNKFMNLQICCLLLQIIMSDKEQGGSDLSWCQRFAEVQKTKAICCLLYVTLAVLFNL